ncbi:hypothetical protein B9Z55_002281 [Caenorhabditis nigoni]|uniref:Uncharacterized protein n=1 Tax=Caenorhabditis nigoni TaxID=1611254 RepID=A0A2G5VJS5_9PELO|nr:hypothetical protein B9Z55_002281 [Caenorhabditis nigoni]
MPIITLVTGFIYLVFGSYKTFRCIELGFVLSCVLALILATAFGCHLYRIAKATSGNLVCPRTFALQMLLTHFSMIVVIAAIMVSTWIPPTLGTKCVAVLMFVLFGYLLNIGAGTFPTFSVADPFYWNQNRTISPSYDRAIKSALLAIVSYCFAHLSCEWHSIATMILIFFDVVLMAHYWEIAGFEERNQENERNDNDIRDLFVVEDPHMD